MTPPSTEPPAAAAVIRDFVNTLDLELGTDDWESADGLGRWLGRAGLSQESGAVTASELELARRLRAGLRDALELNHDGATDSLPALAGALGELPVTLAWDGSAPVLTTSADGVLGGLARVAVSAHETVAAGDWPRLKICALDECAWAYYDHSKNRSRFYCEHGCGNKIKTRAYRARQRAAGAAG